MASTGGNDVVTNKQLYDELVDLREFISNELYRKADLVMLTDARKQVVKLEDRVSSLERWRAYLAGAAGVALAVATFAATHFH